MGSPRECTRILGLEGFGSRRVEWEGDSRTRAVRCGLNDEASAATNARGCGRRTWRVRDDKARTWDDLPWAEHPVTLVYAQRRVRCRPAGFARSGSRLPRPARITRRLRK